MNNDMVLGFAFDRSLDRVALIRKKRPAWQAGKLNGVGGKVEPGEINSVAMSREFLEETGVRIIASRWTRFATLFGEGWTVTCFAVVTELRIESKTDERVILYHVSEELTGPGRIPPMISNLQWLIPMAVDRLVNKECPAGVNVRYGHGYGA